MVPVPSARVCAMRPGGDALSRQVFAPLLAAAILAVNAADARAAREPVDDADLQQAVAAYNSRVELESQELVCRREAPVGTRIKKTVCRNKGLLEREQREAKRYVNKPRPVPTKE